MQLVLLHNESFSFVFVVYILYHIPAKLIVVSTNPDSDQCLEDKLYQYRMF